MVEFQPIMPAERADVYFGLLLSLEDMLRYPIDLVKEGASQNPFFVQTAEQSKTLLYAA